MSTTSFTISLPKPLKAFVDRQVASGTFPNAEAYIQALLREAQKREVHERVEALLLEGLNSGPATEMTARDWEDIRREGMKRLAKRKSR